MDLPASAGPGPGFSAIQQAGKGSGSRGRGHVGGVKSSSTSSSQIHPLKGDICPTLNVCAAKREARVSRGRSFGKGLKVWGKNPE